MNRPLYLAALRVLGQMTNGMNYSPEDLSLLRRHAGPGETSLPVDVLCCEIIQRELGQPKQHPGPVPVDPEA